MLLLTHKAGTFVIPVGLLASLDIDNDFDIITDIMATHFKKELASLRPDLELDDQSVLVIREVGVVSQMDTTNSSWELTYGQFTDRPAKRVYTLQDLPILNDVALDDILKPLPMPKNTITQYRAVQLKQWTVGSKWTPNFLSTFQIWDTDLDKVSDDFSGMVNRWYGENYRTAISETSTWIQDDFEGNEMFDGTFIKGLMIMPTGNVPVVMFAIEMREVDI